MVKTGFNMWLATDASTIWSIAVACVIALVAIYKFYKPPELDPSSNESKSKQQSQRRSQPGSNFPSPAQTLHLIQNRRTISPKECVADERVTDVEIEMLLEAANWAPTHKRTEPWRFVVVSGPKSIFNYLHFIDEWYVNHAQTLNEKITEGARKKLSGAIKDWPHKVSHLLLIVVKRHSEQVPEWEEIAAVAMAVQNVHLLAANLGLAVFWSSHNFAKDARESKEMREYLAIGDEDLFLGALTVGRPDPDKVYKSARDPMASKVRYVEDE